MKKTTTVAGAFGEKLSENTINSFIPEAIRKRKIFGSLIEIQSASVGEDYVSLYGKGVGGEVIDMKFALDGTVLDFEIREQNVWRGKRVKPKLTPSSLVYSFAFPTLFLNNKK